MNSGALRVSQDYGAHGSEAGHSFYARVRVRLRTVLKCCRAIPAAGYTCADDGGNLSAGQGLQLCGEMPTHPSSKPSRIAQKEI